MPSDDTIDTYRGFALTVEPQLESPGLWTVEWGYREECYFPLPKPVLYPSATQAVEAARVLIDFQYQLEANEAGSHFSGEKVNAVAEGNMVMRRSDAENCCLPAWYVVNTAAKVGVQQPLDRPWRFVGRGDAQSLRVACNSNCCLPRKPVESLGQKPGDEVLFHYVWLSREEFSIRGTRTPFYIGQCRRCGFVYWGEVEGIAY